MGRLVVAGASRLIAEGGGPAAQQDGRANGGAIARGMTMRRFGCAVLAMLALAPPAGLADELRITAWNPEYLDDTDGAGCVGRSGADYAALRQRIADLDADIVAF